MPAIHLERLSEKVDDLVLSYNIPEDFVRKLHDLLSFYADRTYRSGQDISTHSLLPLYKTPPQINQEILHRLNNKAQNAPMLLLNLCDALWLENNFESKLLACELVSLIPTDYAETVFIVTSNWLIQSSNIYLQKAIIEKSLYQIRKQKGEEFLTTFTFFIQSPNIAENKIGLLALKTVLNDEAFINLPRLFQILTPMMRNFPEEITMDVSFVIELLIIKSPLETLHFLSQTYSVNPSIRFQAIIRKVIPQFSETHQHTLRVLINNN